MSEIITAAIKALNARLEGGGVEGSIRFVIEDEGEVLIDEGGARASDGEGEADCVLTADAGTFQGMLEGDVNPTSAFMSGKLKVDGDMGLAMKLGSLLG